MNKLKYIIIILVFLSSCSKEKKEVQIAEEQIGSSNGNEVVLSFDQVKAIKLKSGKIERKSLSGVIKANGYLDVPPQNKAVISPMITGYVRKVNYLLGDMVKKGAVMAELESIEYIDLQQQYMELKSRIEYLSEDYERQKLLRQQDAVSKKKYLQAEVDYNIAISTLDALATKLRLMGTNLKQLDQQNIQSKILLKAPISGSVNKLNVQMGKHVDPHEEIYELINTDHLHLELEVYQKDVPKVKKDQKVRFYISSLGNREFTGEVFLVGKDLSEEKRSINVHVHFNDDEADFSVGMYGTASIVVEENLSYTLPVTAVVVDGNAKYVFKKSSTSGNQSTFQKIEITTGIESDGMLELTNMSGLTFEDEIVTDGAFYLLNAFSDSE